MRTTRWCAGAALALAAATITAESAANPRALPFTYPYETLPKGEGEVEQYLDFTPTRALSTSTGAAAWLNLFLFQTELEYGLTDRLELGLYLQLAPGAGDGFSGAAELGDGNAVKQRLRLRLAEEGVWPVGISLYGEVVESVHAVELEAKVNLQRRFGALRLMANLSAEHEFYFDGRNDWILNPSLGATYQIRPWLHTGVESWLNAEFPQAAPAKRDFALGPHVYVGPTVMLNFGRLWWSNGLYFRASDAARPVQAGDGYGRIWLRSVIGISL